MDLIIVTIGIIGMTTIGIAAAGITGIKFRQPRWTRVIPVSGCLFAISLG
jgi:hypothetical protein